MLIADVFGVDLPTGRQHRRHTVHQGARFGIQSRTGMQTPL
jgi:hypothetical protein